MQKKTHLVLLSYLTVCIVWGSTYLAIRVGVNDMPFLLFAGIRFSASGTIILLMSRLFGWEFPRSRRDYRMLITIGLMLLFGSNGLICWAEQRLESGLTALLIAVAPLFMAAIENLLPHGQRTGPLGWLGLLIGFGGVVILVSPGFSLENHTSPAILAVLGASLIWATGSVLIRRQAISGSMLPGVGIQMLAAGVSFMLLAAFSGRLSLSGASFKGYAALLYLIFIGSILAYSAFMYMLKALPAAKAGTYSYINPAVAVILGALILDEKVTPITVLAAVVILGGVVLVQVSKVSPSPASTRQLKNS